MHENSLFITRCLKKKKLYCINNYILQCTRIPGGHEYLKVITTDVSTIVGYYSIIITLA